MYLMNVLDILQEHKDLKLFLSDFNEVVDWYIEDDKFYIIGRMDLTSDEIKSGTYHSMIAIDLLTSFNKFRDSVCTFIKCYNIEGKELYVNVKNDYIEFEL